MLLLGLVTAPTARAADACAGQGTTPGDTASRIAAIACTEHALWYAPFIDEKGRLASVRVSEAEGLRLRDGATPAWRRVAQYWQTSGLRWPPNGLPSDADCWGDVRGPGAALCRAFLVDTPWSAVFVSYVLGRAGVPGFEPSARHVDYVRAAHRQTGAGPYRLADPDAEAPAVGDLLCYARMPGQAFGAAGFRSWLDRPFSDGLAMHCDIVVSTAGGKARLVGGNVLQGVTMRLLPVNRSGRFWSLPRRGGAEPECTPERPQDCNLSRHDWVALLKLMPVANVPAPSGAPAGPATPCCEVCTLPLPAGMRRCPVPVASPPIVAPAAPSSAPMPTPAPTKPPPAGEGG
ncbi:DUF2272 domain-containing protein [Lysobacter humi (ex Lee et al. 2017)]